MAQSARAGTVSAVDERIEERLPLALRYRPRKLSELTGQRHVAAVLGAELRSGQLPQQLLFSGGSGLGKTTTARIASAAIECETPIEDRADGDACGHCESCLDITTPGRTHPDVIELDAASHGGKDEIREIAASASLAPLRGRKKIYIIDEAHGLTGPGGQAFLKLLEEPPGHVVFMLCTTDPHKLAKANRGRCTEFELLRPSDAELAANLERVATGEGWTLSERVAAAVIAATDPDLGVRGTLMTLEKLTDLLRAGQDPSEQQIGERLGTAAPAALAALSAAVVGGNRAEALAKVSELRRVISDSRIRSGLVAWARTALQAAAAGAGPALELATWRLSLLARTPAGEVWTDLVVSQLASPALDPGPEVTQAQLAEAERLVGELVERCAEAEQRLRELAGAHAALSAAGQPPEPEQPSGTEQPPEQSPPRKPPSERVGARAASALAPQPAAAGPDDRLAVLLSRLDARDRRAAAMLRSTHPALEGDMVKIRAAAGLLARIQGVRALLETEAGPLGLKIELEAA